MKTIGKPITPLADRVKKHYYIDPTIGCWIWVGRVNSVGRPILTTESKRTENRQVITHVIHIYLYEQRYGIQDGIRYFDSRCGNLLCVNPDHTIPRTFKNRLWEHLNKPNGESGCWEWTGNIGTSGYGTITVDRETKLVHRVAYEEHYQLEIPDGLQVCHRCNNRICINPEHLYVGTHNDNMRDMARSNVLKGESNPNSSLTKEQVIEIKSLIKSRMITYRNIANRFGVSHQAIKDIASGRTWKWLE